MLLDADAVRRLLIPSGNDPIVSVLRAKQYERTIVTLAAIRGSLLADAPSLMEQTGFLDALQFISEAPAAVQSHILSYPSVAFWIDVCAELLRRRAHTRFPDLHLATHLESFGTISLAVAKESGRPFSCVTRVDRSGRLVLPGTGSYYELRGADPYERVSVRISGDALEYANRPEAMTGGIVRHDIPTIDGIELNAVDNDLRLPGRCDFTFEQEVRGNTVIRWSSPLTQSRRWIEESDSLLAQEITSSMRCIVPLVTANPQVHVSATFREAPGLIALSWTPDTPVLAEAIVHEYHHSKLNTLLTVDPLIAGPTEQSLFYSPWRPDPRPLLGLLHGAFVFHAVLHFWMGCFRARIPLFNEERLRQRLYLVQRQAGEALTTLAELAELTDCGNLLVEELIARVDQYREVVFPEPRVRRGIDRLMAEHRAQWLAENGDVVSKLSTSSASRTADSELFVGLGLTSLASIDMEALVRDLPADDPLIEEIVALRREGGLENLDLALKTVKDGHGEAPIKYLLRAHVAYVAAKYQAAASNYAALLQLVPGSRYFWQCFAHALRHCGGWTTGTLILTNLDVLARSIPPTACTPPMATEERLQQVGRILGQSVGPF